MSFFAYMAAWLYMVKPAVTSSGFQVDVPLGYSDVTVTKLEGTDVQVRLKSTKFLMNSQLKWKSVSHQSFFFVLYYTGFFFETSLPNCRLYPLFTNQTAALLEGVWLLTNQT